MTIARHAPPDTGRAVDRGEARRRKLELRLHLGEAALLTAGEVSQLVPVREHDVEAWLREHVRAHLVAGRALYRWGDVLQAARLPDEEPTDTRRAIRPTLRRAELPRLGRRGA